MTAEVDRFPAVAPGTIIATVPEVVTVGGPQSTEIIPSLWAERMLTELRSNHPGTWRRLLGNASTGGS